jgi:hypothetical protein
MVGLDRGCVGPLGGVAGMALCLSLRDHAFLHLIDQGGKIGGSVAHLRFIGWWC